MTKVDVVGIHVVRSKGKEYVYAWRGGPRVHAPIGTDAFVDELADLRRTHGWGDRTKLAGLIAEYKASDDWKGLADKTRENWSPWLDRIKAKFGLTSIKAFDRPLMKVAIKKWHRTYKATPRAADMGLQAFSRVLSFAIGEGRLQYNAVTDIPRLYKNDRSAIIWTADDIARFEKHASRELVWALKLACLTGLRKSDLLRLSWSHVGDLAIEIRTGKSRNRKTTLIPIYAELRALLAEIPKRSTTVLTNTKARSWAGGFGSSLNKALKRARIDKHLHDGRGTAATRMYLGGLTIREIAEIFTWSEDAVEEMINTYVKRDELLRDRIRRLDELESRTQSVKPGVKPPTRK